MKDFSATNFDYLIVGGGVIGLSLGIAILESKPKNKVCIFEKEKENLYKELDQEFKEKLGNANDEATKEKIAERYQITRRHCKTV